MTNAPYITIAGLQVAPALEVLIRETIAPGTRVSAEAFWGALAEIVRDLAPENQALLQKRDHLQAQLDAWHSQHPGGVIAQDTYQAFLRDIGYLVPEPDAFTVHTQNVDPEVAQLAGPQLVVPVDNARYALNAANARWGSLYDALYGTNVIPDEGALARGQTFNKERGAAVVAYAMQELDRMAPLTNGAWSQVTSIDLVPQALGVGLRLALANGSEGLLADPTGFVGYRKPEQELEAILLQHHGLRVEVQIDATHAIGRMHPAGIKDVLLESAITTIADCEDSVAAVDAEDKARVYSNWAGLMKGDLSAAFEKNGKTLQRRLQPDRNYTAANGQALRVPGRSLLLVRNVGLHMYTDAVRTSDGQAIPEGMLDAMVTAFAALHDLNGTSSVHNSQTQSVYIVKPKLHGPEEVGFMVKLAARVEAALGMAPNTIKLGIMDEERRTTVNLAACIAQAQHRVIFINTGFLDRTGDEIHTLMEAGPVVRKQDIKAAAWIAAYENWNVDVGLAVGLAGRGQIGKGMWAMPDEMRAMMDSKGAHPRSGASTAWVPSPTAATLHALHYHHTNVSEQQQQIRLRPRASLNSILTPAVLTSPPQPADIQAELDNNAQGILGYVVRWIDQGVGCSKVPDIHDMGLMEDRATLRISSQHIANWLRHGLVSEAQVRSTFERIAGIVDRQNAGEPGYRPLVPVANNLAFAAALDLVFHGQRQANGYTEPTLHKWRRERKRLS